MAVEYSRPIARMRVVSTDGYMLSGWTTGRDRNVCLAQIALFVAQNPPRNIEQVQIISDNGSYMFPQNNNDEAAK